MVPGTGPVSVPREWEMKLKELQKAIEDEGNDKLHLVSDFYPDGFSQVRSKEGPVPRFEPAGTAAEEPSLLESVAPVVDKVLPATELLLFLFPPWGLVADAGLTLLWSFLRPSELVKPKGPEQPRRVQESTQQACSKAIDAALKKEREQAVKDRIKAAAEGLQHFQTWLTTQTILLQTNVTADDFKALEHDTLDTLGRYVLPDGSLVHAFRELKDTMGWFDTNHETLLCLSLQSIFQAYTLRCMAYIGRALHYCCEGLQHGYNRELGFVRMICATMHDHLLELHDELFQKLKEMGEKRLNDVKDTSEEKTLGDYRLYLVDAASQRQFLVAAGETAMMRGDEIYAAERGRYVDRLRAHLAHAPTTLISFLYEQRDQLDVFMGARGAGTPHLGPIYEGCIDLGIDITIPVGTLLSFRFELLPVDAKETDVGKTSPWSEWVIVSDPRYHAQFLIGDGYAAVETKRRIWVRCRFPGIPAQSNGLEPQAVVDEITGHGIMLWPNVIHYPKL